VQQNPLMFDYLPVLSRENSLKTKADDGHIRPEVPE